MTYRPANYRPEANECRRCGHVAATREGADRHQERGCYS